MGNKNIILTKNSKQDKTSYQNSTFDLKTIKYRRSPAFKINIPLCTTFLVTAIEVNDDWTLLTTSQLRLEQRADSPRRMK